MLFLRKSPTCSININYEEWKPLNDYPKYIMNARGEVKNSKNDSLKLYNKSCVKLNSDYIRVKLLLSKTFPEYFELYDPFNQENYFDEKWVLVKGSNIYCISTFGRIYNMKTHWFVKTFLKPRYNYPIVCLMMGKNSKHIAVHILVGKHFLPNPENKPQINHINGNHSDYHVANLEWSTSKENNIHAAKFITKFARTCVIQMTLDGSVLKEFQSVKAASLEGFTENGIRNCAKGLTSKYKNFIWKYKSNSSTNEIIQQHNETNVIWKNTKDSLFKEINLFDYLVSNTGLLKNNKGKLMKLYKGEICGLSRMIDVNKRVKTPIAIYRVMLMTFNILNPENKREIDHIDGDHYNNDLNNLRWVTPKENSNNENTILKKKRNLLAKKAAYVPNFLDE